MAGFGRALSTIAFSDGSVAFAGKLDRLSFAIDRPKVTPDDEKKLVDAMRATSDAE